MDFPTIIEINLRSSGIPGLTSQTITIYGGITTFLGPNGSGKTQLLRGLKSSTSAFASGKKVRYISSGRLGPAETFRSDYDGHRGGAILYDQASYGTKDQVKRRHSVETILGDIASLSERPDILIKVQERLKKLFNRDLRVDWDGGNLRLYFSRVDRDLNEYSSAREASGLLHLVAILAALYDDDVGYTLIDEPEVSLHPQLQSFLYQEMVKVAGSPNIKGKKLIFLSTHSTEFINLQSVDDLASIVFCSDIHSDPVQIDPTIGEFRNRKIKALLSRMGQEHKLALFCERPLLVEGPSDQIICSGLSRRLDLNTEAAGSQILPVTGKGQMPVVIKLMRLLGKTPSVLSDSDGFADGIDLINCFTTLSKANEIATAKGHRNAQQFAKSIYSDFSQIITDHWDDISHLAMSHQYWINRDLEKEEIIAQKRSAFSTLLTMDSDAIRKLNNSDLWLNMKARLDSLLELLSSVGCFVLKKGTIESYYLNAGNLANEEKPNAAAHEISHFPEMDIADIKNVFKDIIVAIVFAAQAKEINEAEAIRDMLLAIVSPDLANLSENSTAEELMRSAKSLFGNKSSLFSFKIENNNGLILSVHLSTSILQVEGFPLKIPVDSNPITVINLQLNL